MIIRSPKELAMVVSSERKKLKLNQTSVGKLVGLKQATISAFENKPESTKLETLFHILAAVNLDITISSKKNPIENKARRKIAKATKWENEW